MPTTTTTTNLSWSSIPGANYIVQYKKSSNPYIWTTFGTVSTPYCTIIDLDYNTFYDFSVQVVCGLTTSSVFVLNNQLTTNNHATIITERFNIQPPILNDESLNAPYTIIPLFINGSSVYSGVNGGDATMTISGVLIFEENGYYTNGSLVPGFSTHIPISAYWFNPSHSSNLGTSNFIGIRPGYILLSGGGGWGFLYTLPQLHTPTGGLLSDGIRYGFDYTYYNRDSKLIYIGIELGPVATGTQNIKILIDGLKILQINGNTHIYQIYPIRMPSGSHIISMVCNTINGTSSVDTCIMAVEIYDNTLTDIINTINRVNLNIIFSTRTIGSSNIQSSVGSIIYGTSFTNGTTVGWSNPIGYNLDTTDYLISNNPTDLRSIKRMP